MNLTHEKRAVPIEEYLKIVQQNAKAKKQSWRHIGQIETLSGAAELTEIEAKTPFGEARIFQAILYAKEDVFILTTSALKKDFGKYAPSLKKAIGTMRVVDDLFSIVVDTKIQALLRAAWQKKRSGLESDSFKEMVFQVGNELGPVWQLQILKE